MDTPTKQQNIHIERDRNGLYGLYVANLAPEINENDLRGLFISSGFIEVCKILKNHHDKTHVAFVKFAKYEEALAGLQKVNGTTFGGLILEVRPAYENQRRMHRYGKEKSPRAEFFKQGGQHATTNNNKQCSNNIDENGTNTDCKDGNKEESNKTGNLPQKESPTKSVDEAKLKSYILPPTSQDVRYSNGNGSTCSGSSFESLSDKSPVKSTAFNKVPSEKPQGKAHQQIGVAPNFDGLKKSDTSHSTCSGQAKLKFENKPRSANASKSNLQASTQLAQNMSNVHLGNDTKCQNGPLTQGNVSKWSVEEVAKFFQCHEECTESMVTFVKEQEIDGNALMLIEESSLLHFMKLGPALKFLNLREKLKN